jgi:aldehyde:ferredoxin oxidoreductase
VLVLAASVVTGHSLSGFNRYTAAAKSPLTGCFGESEAAGYFGPELKFAGFDAIVIFGKAPKPVYIYIKDGQVEIKDAAKLWGRDNWETLLGIQGEVGDKKVRVVSIGPAGEKLVRFACIANDVEHFNGRVGMGAVMGSKNLKAVAVRGNGTLSVAEPEKFKEVLAWQREYIKENALTVFMAGSATPGLVKGLNATGILPTRNFSEGVFEGAAKISWDAYKEEIFKSKGSCWMCLVACKRRVTSDDPNYPLNAHWGGPEYEALGSLGSQISNDNLKAVETPHDPIFQGEGYRFLAPLGLLEPVKPLETDAAKVRFFYLGQKAWGMNNLLGLCNFASVPVHGLTFEKLVDAVKAITGWNTSLYDIVRAVDRSLVMARMFNVREGVGPQEDRVIRRWHEAFPSGPLKGQKIDEEKFKEAVKLYYQMSGWDEQGKPLPGKLIELNLEFLLEEQKAS